MKRDEQKTKAELLQESNTLRRRVAQSEQVEHKDSIGEIGEPEQIFRTIFENAADGIALASVENKKFHMANRVFCQLLGYNSQEIKNLGVMDIYPEEDLPFVLEQFDKQAMGKFTLSKDIPVRRRDGHIFYADINAFPVTLANKTYLMGIFRNITEHKQAEEEIRASEETFRGLAERMFDIVFMTDTQGYLTYVSPASEKILNYKPEEMVGTHFKKYLIKSEIPRVSKRFAENIKSKNLGILQMEAMRKDGSGVFVELSSSPIIKDGKIIGIQGAIRDITDRKKTEEELQKSEQKYKGLSESLNELVYRADPKTFAATYVNVSIERLYGYSIEEWLGDPSLWENSIHPDDKERTLKEFDELRRTLNCGVIRYRIIHKNKTVRWVDDHVSWEKDPHGKVISMNGVMYDITELKRAEDELRESESRYKVLFQGTSEGILVADIETKELKYANPAICKMLGYTEEEMNRMRVHDIHPKRNLEYVLSEFEAQARGEKVLSPSVPCLRKDGKIIYADVKSTKLMIGGRECNVGFFTDITERKRVKADLENYKEKVLQAQKHAYISSIGTMVAHQVNQPLTTINMLLEKAFELEQAKDNCCQPVLQRIKKSLNEAKRAASIIRKFHQYSRDPNFDTTTNVNASRTVNRIISMLSERAELAKTDISTKSLDDLPEVEINETALEQLFLIIIQNAIEASDGRRKHRLSISGGFVDSKVELQFSDDCGGIAPENLDKIFEPFFSTKSDSKGIGLGLDIAQQILISCGGEIRAESQFGKGATFYVSLPISSTQKS